MSELLDVESEVEFLTAMGGAVINLRGSRFSNTLTGNAAANRLDGGAGADTMAGGAGNDVYVIDNASDTVVESAGGTDTIETTVSYLLAAGVDVEFLIAKGTGAINLTANGQANTLTGNAAANLYGGAGADRMVGGAGSDICMVDNAADTIVELAGEGTVDRVLASTSYTLAATAEIEFLDAAVGTAVRLTGSGFANTISGNAGADVLVGMDGNDTLYGNIGNDMIYGGFGADLLSGGVGKDIFVFDTAVAKKKNANIDKILDFNVKDDTIHLENAIFKGLGKKGTVAKPLKLKKDAFFHGNKAHDRDDHIIITKTGKIYYDADGTGKRAQIHVGTEIAKVAKAMTEKDFMII